MAPEAVIDSAVTPAKERFLGTWLLVIGQTILPVFYLAGAALPYLFTFTLKGISHCMPPEGCRSPGDVFHGPMAYLAAAGSLATIMGMPALILMLLGTFTSWGARRRKMSPALRRWLAISVWLSLAFLVFNLLPPGRMIMNWVLD